MAATIARAFFVTLALMGVRADACATPAAPTRDEAPAARPGAAGHGPKSTPSGHEIMLRCARRWQELKRSGAASRMTWRGYWAQCSGSP